MNKILVLYLDYKTALYVNNELIYYTSEDVGAEDLVGYCPIESINTLWVGENILINGRFPKVLSGDLTQYKL